MFIDHYYVTGTGLHLGHVEVDEKIVFVVIKLVAFRGDRHRIANSIIHYIVSVVVGVPRRLSGEGGALGQQRFPEEVTFDPRTCWSLSGPSGSLSCKNSDH